MFVLEYFMVSVFHFVGLIILICSDVCGNKIKIVVQSLLKKAKATKVNLINFLETKK